MVVLRRRQVLRVVGLVVVPGLVVATQVVTREEVNPWLIGAVDAAEELAAQEPTQNPIDEACPTVGRAQRGGRDPCACQIRCTDMQCGNAKALCTQLDWCASIEANGAKRLEKKVATLKRNGRVWSVDKEARTHFARLHTTAFIIGEQKCGTTLLYDALMKAGAAKAPNGRKEQHFYDSHRVLNACRAKSYLDGFVRKGLVIDATPDYLADPIAAAFLFKTAPTSKFVALTRDPTERAHAAWDQNRRSGAEGRDFPTAVRHEFPTAKRCLHLANSLADATGLGDYSAAAAAIKTSSSSSLGGGGPGVVRNVLLNNASHALLEYSERCLLFFQGRPRNCWVNHEYNNRPQCKRYLQKGFFGFHLHLWASLFPPDHLGHLRADTLFGPQQQLAVANVARFLGLQSPSSSSLRPTGGLAPLKQTCWHDCNQAKRRPTDDIPPDLRATLDTFFRPSVLRLSHLLATRRLTSLDGGQQPLEGGGDR